LVLSSVSLAFWNYKRIWVTEVETQQSLKHFPAWILKCVVRFPEKSIYFGHTEHLELKGQKVREIMMLF
jgi:hypothetical protein